ncbi:MAG: hypothetical protein RID09_28075 [Coleofasciculus sp. G1-WW12-02]
MALSEFLKKKISLAFNKYDLSNDGVLTVSVNLIYPDRKTRSHIH